MSNPAYQAARAQKSREKILNAALGLFVERGFDAVGLKDIAKAAKVSTATVFAHYPEKDTLLTGAVALLADMRDEAPAPATPPATATECDAALRTIGLSYARRLDHPMLLGLVRMGVTMAGKVPGLGQAVNDAWRRPFIARLERALDHGITAGQWIVADRAVATRQFFGLMTDALLWPRLFGISDGAPAGYKEAVVDEAIRSFNARYRPK